MPPNDPSLILQRASAVFHELSTSPHWLASLEQATIQPTPLFVRALEPSGHHRSLPLPDYAIVTLARGAGITARFALHALNGQFLEAEGVRVPGSVLPAYADVAKLAAAAAAGPIANPAWVWGPCVQSTSRFLPFWRYEAAGQTRYARADGPIFDALTTTVLG